MTDTRKGGRPAIGPPVMLRMPQELIDRLDAYADQLDTTRSELLRRGAEMVIDDLGAAGLEGDQ